MIHVYPKLPSGQSPYLFDRCLLEFCFYGMSDLIWVCSTTLCHIFPNNSNPLHTFPLQFWHTLDNNCIFLWLFLLYISVFLLFLVCSVFCHKMGTEIINKCSSYFWPMCLRLKMVPLIKKQAILISHCRQEKLGSSELSVTFYFSHGMWQTSIIDKILDSPDLLITLSL